MEKESVQMNRQCTLSRLSPLAAGSSTCSCSIQLLYKNVCILCNQPAHFSQIIQVRCKGQCETDISVKGWVVIGNGIGIYWAHKMIADGQRKSLLKTARDRKGNWGIEVIGCLEGISDFVAKQTMHHLHCKVLFETGGCYSKTKAVSDLKVYSP